MIYWNVTQYQYQNKIIERSNVRESGLGQRLIDIGCGNGTYSHIFSDGAAMVVGVDIELDSSFVKLQKTNKNLHFVLADACNLPFKENTFHIVFEKDTLHHITDHNKALEEIHRIAAKKSKIFIIEANRYNPISYIHMTLIEGHQHFSRKYLFGLIRSKFKNGIINHYSIENHVYPVKSSFLLNVIQKFENLLEKIPIIRNYLSYNIIMVDIEK